MSVSQLRDHIFPLLGFVEDDMDWLQTDSPQGNRPPPNETPNVKCKQALPGLVLGQDRRAVIHVD